MQDEPWLCAAEVALDVGEDIQGDCAIGNVGGWHLEAAEVRDGSAQTTMDAVATRKAAACYRAVEDHWVRPNATRQLYPLCSVQTR